MSNAAAAPWRHHCCGHGCKSKLLLPSMPLLLPNVFSPLYVM
jgi:hypothetical protein